jgi:hypothetical protein
MPELSRYRLATTTRISVGKSPQSSSFFRLPPEIRMMIYGFVFENRDVFVHKPDGPCSSCYKWLKFRPLEIRTKTRSGAAQAAQDLQALRTTKSPLAIALTCRQIYHDAIKAWYENVRFYFFGEACMAVFLAEIGPFKRLWIRYVGCGLSGGSSLKPAPDVVRLAYTYLIGLRSLSFDCGRGLLEDGDDGTEFRKDLKDSLARCEEEARALLSMGDQLAVLIFSWNMVKPNPESQPLQEIGTLESLEMRRDNTGKVVTTSSRVEYSVPQSDGKWVRICGGGEVFSIPRI